MSLLGGIFGTDRAYRQGFKDGRESSFDLYMPSRNIINTQTVEMQRLGAQHSFREDLPLRIVKREMARLLANAMEEKLFDHMTIEDIEGDYYPREKTYRVQIDVGLRALTNGEIEND